MTLVRRTQSVSGPRPVNAFWPEAAWALATALIALLVAWHAIGFSRLGLQTPASMSADASATAFLFASTHENGWYQPILRAGAPFGTRLTDTPNADGLGLLLNHVFGRFTDDPFVLLNLFVLASFMLCPIVAFAVYRRLGLRAVWAAVATLAFSLLPAHFQVDQQPLSALYLAAALAAWLALDVVWQDRAADGKSAWRGLVVLAAVVCGLSGTYLAFFTCLIVGTAGAAGALQSRSPRPLRRAGIVLAIVLVTTAVQLAPSWLNTWREGGNASLVAPGVREAESNGLKIAPMLLPRIGHGIDALAALRARYEGGSATTVARPDLALGILGACGLLLLLVLPLIGGFAARARAELHRPTVLVYAGLVFATVGAFGSLFALFVTPQLHRLDRIAPFIAFLAILASLTIVQSLLARRGPRACAAVALLIATLCIVDQSGLGANESEVRRAERNAAFVQERAFHTAIESALPARSLVLQLPLSTYPARAAQVSTTAPDPFAGYLHTRTLRWSGGATPGRLTDRWQQLLDAFPLHKQLPALAALGFSGIVLDRRGHADPAPIEAALAAANLEASLHSADATRSLYPIPNAKAERYRAYAIAPLDGWSEVESNAGQVWIWSTGNASLRMANTGGIARPCYVDFDLESLQVPRKVTLRENGRAIAETSLMPGIPSRLSAYLDERDGERTLELVTDAPAVSPGAQDSRMLAFRLIMRTPPLCR